MLITVINKTNVFTFLVYFGKMLSLKRKIPIQNVSVFCQKSSIDKTVSVDDELICCSCIFFTLFDIFNEAHSS